MHDAVGSIKQLLVELGDHLQIARLSAFEIDLTVVVGFKRISYRVGIGFSAFVGAYLYIGIVPDRYALRRQPYAIAAVGICLKFDSLPYYGFIVKLIVRIEEIGIVRCFREIGVTRSDYIRRYELYRGVVSQSRLAYNVSHTATHDTATDSNISRPHAISR